MPNTLPVPVDADYEIVPEFEDVGLVTDTGANKRLLCSLVLDTSGSMGGDPIRDLNAGLQNLVSDLCSHGVASEVVELSIIRFGGRVQQVQDFTTPDAVQVPALAASGGTPMGEAVEVAVQTLRRRTAELRAQGVDLLVPWVFLITDGQPTDSIARACQLAAEGDADRSDRKRAFMLFAVGTETADFNRLKKISPARPPLRLADCDFPALFKFVSQSLGQASASQPGQAVQATLPQQITFVT